MPLPMMPPQAPPMPDLANAGPAVAPAPMPPPMMPPPMPPKKHKHKKHHREGKGRGGKDPMPRGKY